MPSAKRANAVSVKLKNALPLTLRKKHRRKPRLTQRVKKPSSKLLLKPPLVLLHRKKRVPKPRLNPRRALQKKRPVPKIWMSAVARHWPRLKLSAP